MRNKQRQDRAKLNRRIGHLLAGELPKLQGKNAPSAPNCDQEREGATKVGAIMEDGSNGAAPRKEAASYPAGDFNEAEFWRVVRRLAAHQKAIQIPDKAFVALHSELGSATSWRLLQLLAHEREVDLTRWFRRLKPLSERLEAAGVNLAKPCNAAQDGTAQRVEAQELVLLIERKRLDLKLTENAFGRQYHEHIGSDRTWRRLVEGEWQSMRLSRWLPKLRDLVAFMG